MNLHNQIMNIPTVPGSYNDEFCYKLGHRDARHAAAELSLKYDALIQDLLDHAENFGAGLYVARIRKEYNL